MGDFGELEDANFRYWYTLTSVDAGDRTARVYMMNFKREEGDEDGDGQSNESLFPSGGNGSIDWVIPSQLVSERGNAYTITEFDADPTNGAADLDHPDGSGAYPTYRPIQFVRSITVPASIESIAPVGERSTMNMQWSHSSVFDHVKSIAFEEGGKVKELPACFAHQLWFLSDVTLPAGLEEIGTCAFWECFSLGDITLPSSLKAIGKMAFADTNLGAVAVSDGLEAIGDGAFAWYDYLPTQFGDTDEMQALAKLRFMTEVVIPGSVKTIEAYAFVQKGNTSISGPASELDYRAWWQGDVDAANDTRAGLSRITSIQLGEGVEEIGAGAFAGSRVAEVTIPASVKSIGQGAFAVSDIAAVNWADPENSRLETLSGFNDCAWLSSIDIPQSVTAVGEWAFQNSTGLTSVFIPANVASTERGASPYTDAVRISADGSDVPENEKWVTQEARDALDAAKVAAAAVAADDAASQALVDEVRGALEAAKAGYVPKAGSELLSPALIDFTKATIDPIPDQAYTGAAITPGITVRLDGKALSPGSDYFAVYADNTDVGTATVTVTGAGLYSGTKTVSFAIVAASPGSDPAPEPTPDPAPAPAPEPIATQVMYRLYNPNSGEHFYTASAEERDNLKSVGWNYEGEAWTAPVTSGTPVYRLYNGHERLGDHHYTTSKEEYDKLVAVGWTGEDVGWYSDDAEGEGLYRLYNPNAYPSGKTGAHHYTTSKEERDWLVSLGWQDEGYGWYGAKR